MSLLVIGLSHRTAPIALLEAVAGAPAGALAHRVAASDAVGESVVLTTCNRLEVYAEAVTFHGAVAAIGESLASVTGVDRTILTSHLYVHFEDRAVAHAFSVAAGLDSMAVGEAQVLGQLRDALRNGQRAGTVGESLNSLLQQALRVGKRAHHETAIDTVSRSLVEAGLDEAEHVLGDLGMRTVLVVGAGGMSSLAATTAARRGVGRILIANRTLARGERLAETLGARAVAMDGLVDAMAEADVVVSSTGSAQYLIGADLVAAAAASRAHDRVFVDLALPHDVDPVVAQRPDTTLVGLAELGALLAERADVETLPEVQAVRDLVTGEVAAYLAARMVKSVAPTVAALRSRAAAVVAAEMERLDHRLPDLDEATRLEFQHAVHRVVEKLLHTPTVRVKELTSDGHGEDYAAALRELFDLDPHTVAAVSTPPGTVPHEIGGAP
ncbi:MAG TPA: glutamyl-tRNA reductase [Lapillicoccus sp.]|nr:glutamyl-tRNA reductase [Lapillicoccus sp.]